MNNKNIQLCCSDRPEAHPIKKFSHVTAKRESFESVLLSDHNFISFSLEQIR